MNRRVTTDDEILTLLVALLAGPPIVLALIPGLAGAVGAWLTAHQVLVPDGPAVLTIPGLNAGPDGRRLMIGVLLLAAAALVAWGWRARRSVA